MYTLLLVLVLLLLLALLALFRKRGDRTVAHDERLPHPFVCEWSSDQTFVCAMCQRTACYCQGAADDMPDVCDECWCDAHSSFVVISNP